MELAPPGDKRLQPTSTLAPLAPGQLLALAALAAGATKSAAAAAAGVSRKTLYEWLDRPDVACEYNRLLEELQQANHALALALDREALIGARRMLRSRKTPDGVRARLIVEVLALQAARPPVQGTELLEARASIARRKEGTLMQRLAAGRAK